MGTYVRICDLIIVQFTSYIDKKLRNYCTQEIFGRGKFWRTMQVKAIGKANKQQLVHAYAIYIFHVSVNIGKESFGE